MTPEQFIGHWSPGGGGYGMNERAGAQPHFIDLCNVIGVQSPNDADNYSFEYGAKLFDGKRGFADVFKRGAFAWEYKQPGGDLVGALRRLKDYGSALHNPPLLVVSDRMLFRIFTQFTGRPTETYEVSLKELSDPTKREVLRRAFTDPASFQPKRTNRDITETAAKAFADVAERMRRERGEPPERVAHFLTQCLFCFFAEDVGLLPARLFEKLVTLQIMPEKLRGALVELFEKMNTKDGALFGTDAIPWFNGGLFQKIDVPKLTKMDIDALKAASTLNWSAIDVAIFGTLFERGLDPKKRSQLGAHYTDPATIMRIVTPVVERPLLAEWAQARAKIQKVFASTKNRANKAPATLKQPYFAFLKRLSEYRVLDPACGSGNFLYLALKTLKDIEHSVHVDAEALGLIRELDLVVSPANVLGIELNEYAAELARVTVWIGELQWRLQHGYPFKQNPVLEPLDHIECRDALLAPKPEVISVRAEPVSVRPESVSVRPEPVEGLGAIATSASTSSARTEKMEALWPRADAVIGNPPFVGGSKKRRELGDETFEALAKVYEGRVPPGADLVCYWFDKALQQMKRGELVRAGFVSTQSIRNGANRTVLDAIVADAPIFAAWSDEPWVNEGAAVRVSMICFGGKGQTAEEISLNGAPTKQIQADLTAASRDGSESAQAIALSANANTCFRGSQKIGPFDIAGEVARKWLTQPNPHGKSNADVLKPCWNGLDLARRHRDSWIVDFGTSLSEADAALFEKPFVHVVANVKPERIQNNRESRAKYWWRHGDAQPKMRAALRRLPRYIATPEVAKHRLFAWMHGSILPDKKLMVVARSDDATFGILQSRVHEIWSLRMGSIHGDGNDGGRPRYTPTTCFETFPFPAGLTPRDTAHQRTEVLEDGAVIPAGLAPSPLAGEGGGEGLVDEQNHVGAASHVPPHPSPLPRGERGQNGALESNEELRNHATAIARAAKRLNDLRERWLNPPEWTEAVPEVIPLGMEKSPYPDRILPRPNLGAADLGELKKRTLTNLYNQRPAWLADAHAALDAAVAAAYGWADYSAAMTDNEILARLLALNHERAA